MWFQQLVDPYHTQWLYSCVFSNIFGSFQTLFIAELYGTIWIKKTALFKTGYDSGPQSIEVLSGGEKYAHQQFNNYYKLRLSSNIGFWSCLITDAECWQISAAKII